MDYQLLPGMWTGELGEYLRDPAISVEGDLLIVTSPTVGKIDAVQQAEAYLNEVARSVTVRHISPEAPIGELDQILEECRRPDHIIAIGGGSVIDAAKVLSIAVGLESAAELFYQRVETPTEKIPVTAVPTTAGTGAELSHGAILYDREATKKGGVRGAILQPDAVVIDPRLHVNAPRQLIAEAGFDCLTHAVETYCSKASNAAARYQSVRAVETVFRHLPSACSRDRQALEQMAIAAAFMGVNLAYSRTCLPHRIQYVIGPFTQTSHAQGLIMLYRGWLPLIVQEPEFQELAGECGMSPEALIEKIGDLKKELSIDHRLGSHGVEEGDVEKLAAQVSGSVELDPCYRDTSTIEQIIRGSI